MSPRWVMRWRGSFESHESLLQPMYQALRNISRRWNPPMHDRKPALNRFAIPFNPDE